MIPQLTIHNHATKIASYKLEWRLLNKLSALQRIHQNDFKSRSSVNYKYQLQTKFQIFITVNIQWPINNCTNASNAYFNMKPTPKTCSSYMLWLLCSFICVMLLPKWHKYSIIQKSKLIAICYTQLQKIWKKLGYMITTHCFKHHLTHKNNSYHMSDNFNMWVLTKCTWNFNHSHEISNSTLCH